MGKISPASIKYNIIADFEAEGHLEKPDVIGAIFGQTEGLLGSEMELRELQQEGKIGRIEVELTKEDGKTKGKIIIPSALDKTETAIIGAALETIDKVGPTEAKIVVKEIEDIRGNKRDYIMQRAKELLSSISKDNPEMQEIEKELKESKRMAKLTSYGEENLPAGDLSGKEIIVVEGRADVINLIKHNITNVIGMNGTKLPKEIAKLGEEKEITLFVDGDRGGVLIAKNVCENAKISYIAQAPEGKEVEELSGKEIHQMLRKKMTVEEFFKKQQKNSSQSSSFFYDSELKKNEIEKLKEIIKEIREETCLLLDKDLRIIKEFPIKNIKKIKIKEKPYILLTEKANEDILEFSKKKEVEFLAASSFEKVENLKIKTISL